MAKSHDSFYKNKLKVQFLRDFTKNEFYYLGINTKFFKLLLEY